MANPLFAELIPQIEQKWTDVDGHQFEKMTVKFRDEIVALGEKVTAQDVKNSLRRSRVSLRLGQNP